jgi:hypothetical protein
MERIKRIFHDGKEIIRMDFQGLEDDNDVINLLTEIKNYVLNTNRPTLQLTNITGVYMTPSVMNKVSAITKETEHLVIKDAVVGVVGVKKILFQVYNTLLGGKAKAFNTEEDAMAWLVKE